jgi:hypothetical protein
MLQFFQYPARIKTAIVAFWLLSLVALGGIISHVLRKLCGC